MCRSIKPARTEIFSSESGVNRLKDLHTGAEGQGADLGHHMVFLGFFLIWPFLHGLLSFAILLPLSILQMSVSSGAPRANLLLFLLYMLSLGECTLSHVSTAMYILLSPKDMFTAQTLPDHQPQLFSCPLDISTWLSHTCPKFSSNITPSPSGVSSSTPYLGKWKESLW